MDEGADAPTARVDENLPLLLVLRLVEPHHPPGGRELPRGEPPIGVRTALLDDVSRGLLRERRDPAVVLRLREAELLVVREPRPLVRDAAPRRRIDSVHPQEAQRQPNGALSPDRVLGQGVVRLRRGEERGEEHHGDPTHHPERPPRQRPDGRNRGHDSPEGRRRSGDEAHVRVRLPGRRQESSAAQVEHQRHAERQEQDARGDRARHDVVRVARTQQQQRGVDRVDREVPEEQRNDAESQHQRADEDAGRSHLEPADEEGLIRIRGVPESPDVGGDDHGEDPARAQAVEERDREHPADPLLGHGREETDQEHGGPRQRGVEHVAVRHVRRRPRAEVLGDDVEHRLVREEERGERVAQQDRAEESLRLEPAQRERAAERDLPREPLAVDRLGRGDHERDARAGRDRAEHAQHDLPRQVSGQRTRRVVLEQGQRQVVQSRQQRQREPDAAERRDEPPGDVLAHDLRDEDGEHREDRDEQRGARDLSRGVVLRAQAVVVAHPGFGDVDRSRGSASAGRPRRSSRNGSSRRRTSRPASRRRSSSPCAWAATRASPGWP